MMIIKKNESLKASNGAKRNKKYIEHLQKRATFAPMVAQHGPMVAQWWPGRKPLQNQDFLFLGSTAMASGRSIPKVARFKTIAGKAKACFAGHVWEKSGQKGGG